MQVQPFAEFPADLMQQSNLCIAQRGMKLDSSRISGTDAGKHRMRPAGPRVILDRGHNGTANSPAPRLGRKHDRMLHGMSIADAWAELGASGKAQHSAALLRNQKTMASCLPLHDHPRHIGIGFFPGIEREFAFAYGRIPYCGDPGRILFCCPSYLHANMFRPYFPHCRASEPENPRKSTNLRQADIDPPAIRVNSVANTQMEPGIAMLMRTIDQFFAHEASGGILLMLSALAALLVANSAFQPAYDAILGSYVAVTVNGGGVEKPLILWINDGLMAVFFFLIGLELKRELLEGKLRNPRDILLPGMAAVGGMAAPAIVFLSLNAGTAGATGWAIPAATDIAFALGVLALVGDRAPPSLKVFLLTLAILDDLGAILIIALFYTANLQAEYLLMALAPLAAMIWRNQAGAHRMAPTLLLGVALWVLVLKSGVHATLAGVVAAFCIPLKDKWGKSPLHALEHGLAPYVLFLIVPIFAFANAGVVLDGLSLSDLFAPLPLGIAAGLVVGKQVGVFGVTLALVKFGYARLPHGANWAQIYGIACLAGIGFTMSLFIGSLSFDDPALINAVRLGVLSGSAISAVFGYAALMISAREKPGEADPVAAE